MRGFPVGWGVIALWCLVCLAAPAAGAKEELMGTVAVGDLTVTVLSDGYRDLDGKLFIVPEPGQQEALNRIYPQGKTRNSLNVFLVRTGGDVVLIDTGGGTLLGPDAGGLPKALAAAEVKPEEITKVIITHAHRDHVGGLGLGGKAAFPRATVFISTAERDFWTNPENEAKAPERAKPNFVTLREMLALYSGKVRTMEPGQEVAPGLTILEASGHTPGHVAVLVRSKGQGLLIWADLIHGMALQLARPDIAIAFDTDPAAAAKSRQALLDRAVREGWMVTGVHVPGPAAYRIRPDGRGYALVS